MQLPLFRFDHTDFYDGPTFARGVSKQYWVSIWFSGHNRTGYSGQV